MKNKHRFSIRGVALVLALLFPGAGAWADPVISVDLDPVMMGIQSTLTVDPGDSFTIDVVITGDGVAVFDLINFVPIFDVSILGLVGGTGMPRAGALADLADGDTADLLPGGSFVVSGDLLATSGLPGEVRYKDFPVMGNFGGAILDGVKVVAASISFDSLAGGTSSVGLEPSFLSVILLGDNGASPLTATIVPGSVTVTPEPSTILLLGTGLVGLAAWRLKKR